MLSTVCEELSLNVSASGLLTVSSSLIPLSGPGSHVVSKRLICPISIEFGHSIPPSSPPFPGFTERDDTLFIMFTSVGLV